MSDPEAIYARLANGDVSRILAVTEPVTAAAKALDRAHEDVPTIASWTGAAASGFAARAESTRTAATTARDRLTSATQVLEAAAAAYRTMRGSADELIRVWRERPSESVAEALSTLRSAYEGTLLAYAETLRDLTPAFAATAGGAESWQRTALRAGLTVPAFTDPKAAATWWKGLSETERDQLVATRFDDLAQLGGLPSDVRDDANRRRVEVDQTRYAAVKADVSARIAQRAASLGMDPADEGTLRTDPVLASLLDQRQDANRRLDNANAATDRIAEAGGDAYVLSYDGTGDGRLVIAHGNPDTAQHVAVVVPGTGTTLDTLYPNNHAAALRAEMGPGSATIAWLGYDAPGVDLSVASPDNARAGAESLVSDVDGYRAAGAGHVTVIGHSYGSVTVGYAAMSGLAAEDIAFLGSPGVGASHVDQLSPGAGHVWAGATEHDPIVQLTNGDWFTADGSSVGPYDKSFGANQFGASADADLRSAHGAYYDGESLHNLAHIATGDYEAVTAPDPRDNPLSNEDLVPEAAEGLSEAGEHALSGEWDAAWDELKETGKELLNDAGDAVIGGVGEAVSAGKSLLGRLF